MMSRTMKKLLINLVSLSIIANQGFGFVPKTAVRPAGFHSVFAPMLVPQERPGSTIDGAQQILAMTPSADVEAEVLTTMAHVTMDFGGFMNPSKNLLRYFTVLGRVFAISADYIIDHSIHPEELAIQLVLMLIAIREIVVDKPATSNHTK